MAFLSYAEKLSFYAACFLLGSTILFFSISTFKPIVIGYLSILWALFLMHRLFFIIAPATWRQHLTKKLSVRVSKMVDITPQKLKSAVIWRLSQWDVLAFFTLIILSLVFIINNDFILSPNNDMISSVFYKVPEAIEKQLNYYEIGVYSSVFTLYLSILFSFFTFFRSFLSKISFKYLYIVIIGLFITNTALNYSFFINLSNILLLIVVMMPVSWCFMMMLLNKRYARFNSIMNIVTLFIATLSLSQTNNYILGDVITLFCLPILGFFWANARQTPFDSAPKTSFKLTTKNI